MTKICLLYKRNYVKSGCAKVGLHCMEFEGLSRTKFVSKWPVAKHAFDHWGLNSVRFIDNQNEIITQSSSSLWAKDEVSHIAIILHPHPTPFPRVRFFFLSWSTPDHEIRETRRIWKRLFIAEAKPFAAAFGITCMVSQRRMVLYVIYL